MIDDDGCCVALTLTIRNVFGSLLYSPQTGIVLNDTMDRLWKVIKRTAFVIGSALAPTIVKLTDFITSFDAAAVA